MEMVGGTFFKTTIGQCPMSEDIRKDFEKAVDRWIDGDWMVLIHAPPGVGVVPLMAVSHPQKHKARPVLDFKELNQFVHCTGINEDACDDKVRAW